MILVETAILVWFYFFEYLDCFWVRDGYFMDFVIFGVVISGLRVDGLWIL